MNFNAVNNYCQKIIIKNEALEDYKFDDGSFLSLKLKCESGQNDQNSSSCDRSSEVNIFENIFSPIKRESEDSPLLLLPEDVHQVQIKNEEIKEEIYIQDHKPGWELVGRSSNARIFKDELEQCDSVQENVMDRPLGSQNEEQTKYNCPYCPYKTNQKFNYRQHFEHKQCTQVLKYESGIEWSFVRDKQKHSRKVYECEECSFGSRFKGALTRHYKWNHSTDAEVYKCQEHFKEAETYKCQECSYMTRLRVNFVRHYKYTHSGTAVVYKCQECSFETKTKGNLTQHCKSKHSKDLKTYKCQECSFDTPVKRYLTQHYKCNHLTQHKLSQNGEVFKCQECSFETKRKRYLVQHYKCKHSEDSKVHKCEKCSYEAKHKSNLTRHYKCKHSQDAEVYKNVRNVHMKEK